MNQEVYKIMRNKRKKIHLLHNDLDLIFFINDNYQSLTNQQKERLDNKKRKIIDETEGLTLDMVTLLIENIKMYDGRKDKTWALNKLETLLRLEEGFRRSSNNIHLEIKKDKAIRFVKYIIMQVNNFNNIDIVVRDIKHKTQSFDKKVDYRALPAAQLAKVIIYNTESISNQEVR